MIQLPVSRRSPNLGALLSVSSVRISPPIAGRTTVNSEDFGFKYSVCSSRLPVRLYWHAFQSGDQAAQLKRLEAVLFDALDKPTRRWNPYLKAHTIGQIRSRLGEAAEGLLEPPDQVKCIRPPNEHLFEIRWQSLAVTDEIDGRKYFGKTNLRLLFVEPAALFPGAVGLVAFDKPQDETGKGIQDEAIGQATALFFELDVQGWDYQE